MRTTIFWVGFLLVFGTFGGHAATATVRASYMQPSTDNFEVWERSAARMLAAQTGKAFKDRLFETGSAEFRNVFAADTENRAGTDIYICGEVNARNQFGGYAGWQHFVMAEEGSVASPSLDLYMQSEPLGEYMFTRDCALRADHTHLRDRDPAYLAILTGKRQPWGP